ncbi:restriction endonuclease [Thioalkalivibrio paradoxus ARh 1]|uniref:Restriction endonuclease n=2 Tax=Thioalkalivibrio paradoxus TaxID=108010 RepID=W0DJJ5_9GAMM|nr:restriction endonuclease [Thioalkalivibrio paradoxus ARh 1]
MPRVSWEDMGALLVARPPESEQRAIAAFLDHETGKIDALIEEQRRLIELLKEKSQAVISHAVTKGLDPNVPIKDSGVVWLGEVPAHWDVKRIKYLLSGIKAGPFGSSLTKDMYQTSGYRVYGQEQVIPGDFSRGDYFIAPEQYVDLINYAVAPGDILVSCVGTFGRIAIVPEGVAPGIINPRLIRMRVGKSVAPEYLSTVMKSQVVYGQFETLSRGGTMDVINVGTLGEIYVPVPPHAEQRGVVEWVSAQLDELGALKGEAEHAVGLLKERRSALISAAVTGKIDVRGWSAGLESEVPEWAMAAEEPAGYSAQGGAA